VSQTPSSEPTLPGLTARSARFNVFAVAAFVLSLCGGWVVSVVFGIIALVQIKRSGGRGRAIAVVSLVLSVVGIAGAATAVAVFVSSLPSRDGSGHIDRVATVDVYRLETGDCIASFDASRVNDRVDAVPCAQPHHAEVFAVFALPDGAYPGEEKARDLAVAGCAHRVHDPAQPFTGADSLHTFAFAPSRLSWTLRDRDVVCLAYDPEHVRTSSLRG